MFEVDREDMGGHGKPEIPGDENDWQTANQRNGDREAEAFQPS
jgi:hypothetical protein